MRALNDLIQATRARAEIRATFSDHQTEIELWTYPAPADARQSLIARATGTTTDQAAHNLMDQIARKA